jgi:hypothetical protein
MPSRKLFFWLQDVVTSPLVHSLSAPPPQPAKRPFDEDA